MKKISLGHVLRLLAPCSLLLLLSACQQNQDIQLMTQINGDGRTCIRAVGFHTDSLSLVSDPDTLGNDYIRIGRDWQRRWSLTGAGGSAAESDLPMTAQQYDSLRLDLRRQGYEGRVEDTVCIIATRHFPTVEAMSAALPIRLGDQPLTATSTLRKRFRWFYTDYCFSETFASCDTLFAIPLTDFLTADEASYWFTGQPQLYADLPGAGLKERLDDVEQRISRWFNANLFADIYAQLALHYDEVQDAPVSLRQFQAQRDSIMRSAGVLDESFLDVTRLIAQALRDYYHSDAYTPLLESPAVADAVERKYAVYAALAGLSVQYALSMPGTIYDFHAAPLSFTGEQLLPHDYTRTARSRVLHPWAFVVTLLLVLLAIVSVVYKRRN